MISINIIYISFMIMSFKKKKKKIDSIFKLFFFFLSNKIFCCYIKNLF